MRPRRGPRWATARCGGCRSPRWAGSTWTRPGDALALFPGLVSLGTDRTGRVLVDLEAAHGVISVTGPQAMTTAVLSAMAMELATSRWSDRMHITLAGFGDDLTALAPDRITAVPTLEEALPALEAHAAEVAEAMAASGVSSVLEGRSLGVDPDAWTPHYLISAVPPSPWERSRLLALARSRPRGRGRLRGGRGRPRRRLGLGGHARGPAAGRGARLRRAGPAHPGPRSTKPWWTCSRRRPGRKACRSPRRPRTRPRRSIWNPAECMPVEITILGPPSVRAPGALAPDRVALVTELVIYLAVHPGGVHPNVLSAALWPRGVAAERPRTRPWPGPPNGSARTASGRPHLAADASGRLRLGTGVRVDWQVFQALAGHAELAPPGSAERSGLPGPRAGPGAGSSCWRLRAAARAGVRLAGHRRPRV